MTQSAVVKKMAPCGATWVDRHVRLFFVRPRSAKPNISYRDMHNLSNVLVSIKRKYLPRAKTSTTQYFEAERIVERRGRRGKVL